ncbi:MAG: phage GP46 family protein [Betaproteobacteria bacterium]|nr:phage GP46 family protein [Betaproteobacteria bacterium]
MTDFAIIWDSVEGRGDWSVTSGDIAIGNDLETAVMISLFTDRVASEDYVPPTGSPPGRRGWWGDTYEEQLGNTPIGSRLWQLNRAVKNDAKAVLNEARDMCTEALQWLLDDNVATSVTVNTAWLDKQTLGISIQITGPAVGDVGFNFQWAWQGL